MYGEVHSEQVRVKCDSWLRSRFPYCHPPTVGSRTSSRLLHAEMRPPNSAAAPARRESGTDDDDDYIHDGSNTVAAHIALVLSHFRYFALPISTSLF